MAGAETILFAVVIPPPQLKVAPPAVDEAVKVSLVFEQVKMLGVEMLAEGELVFCSIDVEPVLVHPLAGFVTVTV